MLEIYEMKNAGDSILLILKIINNIVFGINYSSNHKCFSIRVQSLDEFYFYYEQENRHNDYSYIFENLQLSNFD